jgi:hypothetical protein
VRKSPRAWFPKLACCRNTAVSGQASFGETALFRCVARPVLPEPGLLVALVEGPKSDVPREAWVPSTSTCVDGRNPLTSGCGWLFAKHHAAAFDPLHYRIFAEQK